MQPHFGSDSGGQVVPSDKKEQLESYSIMGALFAKLIATIGILTLFAYCAFHAQFFPTGLSVGDTLLFLFVALGFGIFYGLWLLLGTTTVYLFMYPFSENLHGGEGRSRFISLLIAPFIAAFLVFVSYLSGEIISILGALLSGFAIVFVVYFGKTLLNKRHRRRFIDGSRQKRHCWLLLYSFCH